MPTSNYAPTVEELQKKLARFNATLARQELDAPTLLGVQQDAASIVGCGLTIADARAKGFPLIYCDKAFLALTGYSFQEVIGRNCNFLQGSHTDMRTVAKIRQSLHKTTPEAINLVLLNYRKDGSEFWNELHIQPISDKDGTVSYFIGIQKDISQQVDKSKALAQSSVRLAHLSAKVEVLEAMVARLLESRNHQDMA